MGDLGMHELKLSVPTRITEKIETNPLLQQVGESVHLLIEIELGGSIQLFSLDHAMRLMEDLKTLPKGQDSIKPDYADRWEELSGNRQRVNRAVIISSRVTTKGGSTLTVKTVGLDPDDDTQYFAKVGNRQR